MKRTQIYIWTTLLLLTIPSIKAQQTDTIPVKTVDSVKVLVEEKAMLSNNESDKTPLNIPAVAEKTQEEKLKDLAEAYKYDSLWMNELFKDPSFFKEMYAEVSKPNAISEYITDLPTDTLKARLERLNQKTPFNISYNPSLESVIKSFLSRKRGLMEKMLTKSQFYFPLFEQELDNYNVPLEVKYLAIVESALDPKAKSRVGATGLWQFMYGTGKMYNLDVSSYVDERSDPINATIAAAKYLKKLHAIYDDWDLALAAYNSGPGNVNKAIRRSGGHKNFWNIRQHLPRETAGYVPAFLATMYVFEYAEEHGLRSKKTDRPYFETDTIHVKNLITFNQVSEMVGISVDELEVLNPAYKLNIIPKVEGKNYTLRLPTKHLGKFVTNEEAIYAHAKKQLETIEKPLPQLITSNDKVRYKVKSGDYLGKIAERHGVGVSQIKRWNGLRSNNLRVGQRLTIYPRKPVTSAAKTKKTLAAKPVGKLPKDPSKIHTVQSGDSLWTISRKYPGISIDNLKKWNGLSGNNLKPGAKLRLCNCSS